MKHSLFIQPLLLAKPRASIEPLTKHNILVINSWKYKNRWQWEFRSIDHEKYRY